MGLTSKGGETSSALSFSAAPPGFEGFDIRLDENISSRVLLTDGRVLWDLSQPPTEDEAAMGGAGVGAMEMDAGVALTATGAGSCGAGGLGALGFMDLAGAGGWDSAASGSLEMTELSWRKI